MNVKDPHLAVRKLGAKAKILNLFAAVGGELRVHIQDRPVAVVICSALIH